MEELTNITVTTYQQYKQAMDTELRRTTEGFVRIGYLLKLARDTDILKDSGYSNVNEFAQAEYNIDKTQVSRFIHINDRFSEGGYSDRLMEKYQNFGHAKLTIMLQLPDELNELLTPEYSKAEIQTMKDEVDEERKITDIEVMLEEPDETQVNMDNNMIRVLHQLFKENPEKFEEVHRVLNNGLAAVLEALAPSGLMMYTIRLQGVGRIAFSVREDADSAELVNVRSGELEKYPWTEVMDMLGNFMDPERDMKSEWERIYKEPFPEKEKVAPVQPEKQEDKPAVRKESRVVKSKPVEKKKPEKAEPPVKEPEEQLPGQINMEDFPEVLPEQTEQDAIVEAEAEPEELLPESAEDTENNITPDGEAGSKPEVIAAADIEVVEKQENSMSAESNSQRSADVTGRMAAGYKAGITNALNHMQELAAEEHWEKVAKLAMDVKWRADKLMELEGK